MLRFRQILFYLIPAAFLLCAMTQLHSQELTTTSPRAIRFFEEGRQEFSLKYYEEAEKSLQKAITADPGFIEPRMLLADVYKITGNPDEALEVYRQVIATNDTTYPEVYFFSGLLFFNRQDYNKSLAHFRQFLDAESGQHPKVQDAWFYMACATFAREAVENPVKFSPRNIGGNVNTSNDEYVNAVKADGLTIYFTGRQSSRNAPGGDDFYYSHRASETAAWQPSVKLGPPVNTEGDEGALTISPDGRYLLFAGCQWPEGYGSCDIFVARLSGSQPGTPVNLGPVVNTGAWESQPSLSSDGRTLYFASARGGGKGKSDIWTSYLQDNGKWSPPANLGKTINTQGSEMAPFIHPDGQTLYFSSDRHVGMGGIDLFFSRLDSTGNWSEPVNLGYPLNTPGDEINVVVDAAGVKGYFSADNFGGFGGYDIFEFELHEAIRPVPSTYMKGVVTDAVTGQPLEAYFSLIDLKTGEEAVRSFSDEITGEFLVCIPVDRKYALNVSKEGYLFYSENFTFPEIKTGIKPYLINIRLNPIGAGQSMVLRNIFFDMGEYDLKPESVVELKKLAEFLKTNPLVKIEISGHTDNLGTAEFNKKLSKNRAREVYDYIIGQGIDPGRLTYGGYGFSQPVADNETAAGRAQNRRTEVTIVDAGD